MGKPLRVLNVEDSESDSLLLQRHLSRSGFDVFFHRVDSGVSMRGALVSGGWDVVIADYSLPGFSAPAALQMLKDSQLDIPFIIVSGAVGEETAVAAMRSGAHDFIMKDRMSRLVPAIERELQEAEHRQARRMAEAERELLLTRERAARSEAEAALKQLDESHALLGVLLGQAATGFAFMDRDQRYVIVNDFLAAMNGCPPDAHIGKTPSEIVPDLSEEFERLHRRVLHTGRPSINYELSGETPAAPGERRHWLVSHYPVNTRSGESVGTGTVIADITQMKRLQEALRESEARLAGQNRVLEMIAQGRELSDIFTEIVRLLESWSPACLCAVGLVESTGRHLRYVCAPSLPATFVAASGRSEISPQGRSGGTAVFRREPVIVADIATDPLWEADREVALQVGLAACSAVPVIGSLGGVLGAFLVFYRTPRHPTSDELAMMHIASYLIAIAVERSQAEEARRLKLATLMEHMGEGVIATDQQGRILVANPAAIRMLNAACPLTDGHVDQAGLPQPLRKAFASALHSEGGARTRVMLSCGARDVEADVTPVSTAFGLYGAVALLQDVTAEMQFRRLQESFVANVSHELRGPLASVSAVTQALRDGVIPESGRMRFLEGVLAELGRMRRLTDDLLDLSKLDAGAMPIASTEFDLRTLCEGVGELWSHKLAQVNLRLEVDAPSLRVLADYDRVEQVLVNFLNNALCFTPPGGVVRIQVQRESGCARVSVADTGIGIPPEHLPYIWERFYKVDQARTSRPDRGSGLGLSISKRLVEQMGGAVHVESVLQQGSVFSFTLPLLEQSGGYCTARSL